jgi:hypothetical protein
MDIKCLCNKNLLNERALQKKRLGLIVGFKILKLGKQEM